MADISLAIAVSVLAASLAGCGRYEAGNLDRANCETLRPGMSSGEVLTVMGKPRHTLGVEGGVLLSYNTPSMADLPMFGGDKPVEIRMMQGSSGVFLEEARCSGVDG